MQTLHQQVLAEGTHQLCDTHTALFRPHKGTMMLWAQRGLPLAVS